MKKISRRSRLALAALVSGALLVPAALLGGAQAAIAVAQYAYGGSGSEYGSGSQYQYRVQICHRTHSAKHPFHTITVSAAAVPAHLRHGDHLGACTGTEPFTKSHGKGNGHGKGQGGDSKTHGNSSSND